MTAQNRTTLKSYFQRGNKPTQAQYGDLIDSFALVGTSAEFVQIAGGTMTGRLTLFASPTAASPDLQAATKRYVDAVVSSGASVGGSNGQIQYNNAGSFGGMTVSGDAASLTTAGVLTLAATGVSAGTYASPTVAIDAKGRVTSATSFPYYSHIAGLLLSSIAGTSTTASASISAGQATDSTNATLITSSGTLSWSVSNGNAANGYQGGTTLPNSDTIHLFVISGSSGIASFAHNGLTPTLPSGYTFFRRIGSFNTTAAGAPIPFITFEGGGGALLCYQTVPTAQTLSVTTSDALYTINYLPTDIRVRPIWSTSMQTNGANANVYPDGVTSAAPASNGTAPGNNTNNNGGQVANNPTLITNTSAQIRIRASTSDSFYVYGYGWEDFRR